jgi:hypothetical protein
MKLRLMKAVYRQWCESEWRKSSPRLDTYACSHPLFSVDSVGDSDFSRDVTQSRSQDFQATLRDRNRVDQGDE